MSAAALARAAAGDFRGADALLAGPSPLPEEALGTLSALPRTPDAERFLRDLAAALPEDPILALGLALRAVERGDAEGSLPRLARAARHAGGFGPGALSALTGSLFGLGRMAEALEAARLWADAAPGEPLAHLHLAASALAARDLAAAMRGFEAAFDLAPRLIPPDLARILADHLLKAERHAEAMRVADAGLTLAPGDLDLQFIRAVCAARRVSMATGHAMLRRLLEKAPSHGSALNALGVQLGTMGRAEDGVHWVRRGVRAAPGDPVVHSNLMLTIQYLPGTDATTLLEEHRTWDAAHGLPLRPKDERMPGPGLPGRRLRVGYVSPDFRIHPVGFFLLGVVAAHDRARFEVFCYYTSPAEDGLTRAFRERAEHWVPCWRDADAELADRIRADGIDLLIDLSGHTSGNRLTVFARRPAPVQATWAGYVGTTGLSAMDYLISDHIHTPPGAERWAVERIARMPKGYVCYAPPARAPDPGPPPALASGRFTYGCFNNAAKLNDGVVELWSRLLAGRADRRLLLQTTSLDRPEVQDPLRRAFLERGVAPDQVEFRGFVPPDELVATYREVDLALDPFPYSGGLTTLEALWMGVPVVTMPGERFCSRHSASHMTNAGLPGFVTASPEGYLAVAEAWTADLDGLARLRATLRQRMLDSPLCDWAGFTADLEALYRRLWLEKVGEGDA